MTKNKRFTIKRKDLKYAKILENGKDLTGYFFTAQAEFIVDFLNQLSDENEQCKMMIATLLEENQRLKAQLNADIDGVCSLCNHHYLVKDKVMQGFYTSKCEKGHEKCSKEAVKYCEDFDLKVKE